MTKLTHDQINQMTLEQFRALLLDPLATTSAAGFVELATDAETQAGTDTTRVVTPASLKSAVPFKTTAAMSLYVNSGAAFGSYGAGSDSNAGTQAAPFATIAAAIAKIPKFLEHPVAINLAGEPNYYEWKPDGTNGIKFTTGDSGVTVAVVAGSSLSVALSGSAVTITLATGGSTIAQIIAAINASETVGPVIFPIAIGTTSTNITATLAAQALTGGNVRTYAEAVTLSGYMGNITLGGAANNTAGVILAPATANPTGFSIDGVLASLQNLTIYTSSASTGKAISASGGGNVAVASTRIVGAWQYGIYAISSRVTATISGLFGMANAVYSGNGAMITANTPYGAGNTIGLRTSTGIILKYAASALGASTAESVVPSGSIIG